MNAHSIRDDNGNLCCPSALDSISINKLWCAKPLSERNRWNGNEGERWKSLIFRVSTNLWQSISLSTHTRWLQWHSNGCETEKTISNKSNIITSQHNTNAFHLRIMFAGSILRFYRSKILCNHCISDIVIVYDILYRYLKLLFVITVCGWRWLCWRGQCQSRNQSHFVSVYSANI